MKGQKRVNHKEHEETEGEMQKRINEAEGKASEILAISRATAASIEKIAAAMSVEGGQEATQLQLTEKLIGELDSLGKKSTRIVLPLNLADLSSVTGLGKVVKS